MLECDARKRPAYVADHALKVASRIAAFVAMTLFSLALLAALLGSGASARSKENIELQILSVKRELREMKVHCEEENRVLKTRIKLLERGLMP